MGKLQGFERRLSGLVNGAVAKVFRGQVQPVEIAQALTDEAEARKVVGASRTLVPNHFVVDLGPGDHHRLAPYADALTAELADIVTEHARDHRWSFIGPVTVALTLDTALETGVFRVRAEVSGSEADIPAAEPAAAPASAGAPAAPAPAVPDRPAPVMAEPVLPADVPEAAYEPAAPLPTPPPAPTMAAAAAVHDALQARLVVSDGRTVALTERVTRLGRSQDADLRVDDTAVSRQHAEVRRQPDGRHLLADLDSTNGTFVNGERATLHWLSAGDRIELGGLTVTYTTD